MAFLLGLAIETFVPLQGPPSPVRLFGGALGAALWLALDGQAMLHFQRAGTGIAPTRPTTTLVSEGPYRISRNPMYLGMASLYAGLAVAFGVIWALILLLFLVLTIERLVVVREERVLEASFGEEYIEYKRRVRRWA